MRKKKTDAAVSSTRFDVKTYPMYYFAHVLAVFDDNIESRFHEYGHDLAQWRILGALQYHEDLTITGLAQLCILERSFVGRVVAGLDEKGFVQRRGASADRRQVRVAITAAGLRVFHEVLRPVVESELRLALVGMNESDVDILLAGLRKVMANVYAAARKPLPAL
jgi:MarR family transcriptional regulator, transcriptional regulator for hemolysin